MDARKIKDLETLQAWLVTRPKLDSIVIAGRIALRVAPVLYFSTNFRQSRDFDSASLNVLCCGLLLGLATGASISADLELAHFVAASATHSAIDALQAEAHATGAAIHATVEATRAIAYSHETADAVSYVVRAADHAIRAAGEASAIWDSIRIDACSIHLGYDPVAMPIWHRAPRLARVADAETAMRTYWQTNNPSHWSFWLRWWDAAIAGRPLDWQLQHDIALIPDAIWQSGPGPVAEAIAKIEEEHKRRVPEDILTTELRNLPKPSSTQVAITRAAMEQNRAALPPTFDAIEGLILLEIEHLQQRNYTDDLDQAEARRQIRIFVTLYDAICALRRQLPTTAPVTDEQAAKSVSLVSLYANKFADLPRMKADEVVEGIWSTGRGAVQASLIGTTTLLGVSYGLPAIAALTIGAMVFAPKNATDLVKAAREAIAPKP